MVGSEEELNNALLLKVEGDVIGVLTEATKGREDDDAEKEETG